MEQKIKQDIVIGYNIRKLRKRAGLTQEQTCGAAAADGVQYNKGKLCENRSRPGKYPGHRNDGVKTNIRS